jgi:preprotein translocase subunit YajC
MRMIDFFAMGQPPSGEQQTSAPAFLQLMPLILLFVVFYLLLIRPQQKQRKEHEAMIKSLRTGDRVVTSGGIHGVVTNVKERTVMVKIADNVKVELNKSAVAAVTQRAESESSSSS